MVGACVCLLVRNYGVFRGVDKSVSFGGPSAFFVFRCYVMGFGFVRGICALQGCFYGFSYLVVCGDME